MADAGAKAHCIKGTHLADQLAQGLEFGRGLKAELRRVAVMVQLLRVKPQRRE
jgi:hypothetical protein